MALVAIEAIMQMTDMASGHGFPSPSRLLPGISVNLSTKKDTLNVPSLIRS